MTRAHLAAAACLAIVYAPAQTPSPPQPPAPSPEVIRLGVDLVRVDATVTDERGRRVPDLTAGDFEITQDGKRQTISSFQYVRLNPIAAGSGGAVTGAVAGPTRPLAPHEIRRSIALIVDDLGLSVSSIVRVRTTLRRFLDSQMQPGDLVAIIRTGAGMGALQQFTSDRRVLEAAVDRIRWNLMARASRFDSPFEVDRLDQLRNEVYAAGTLGAIAYVIRGLAGLPGRKSVMVLSDGFRLTDAHGNYGRVMNALQTVVDASHRSGVVVYGIDMRGLAPAGPAASDRNPATEAMRNVEVRGSQAGLDRLAAETGGIFVKDTNDVSGGLSRMLEDQQGYYLLGYVPDGLKNAGATPRFHALQVRVTRPGLQVRSRRGFWTGLDERKPARPQSRMAAAVTSPFSGGDIRLQLSSFFGYDEKLGAFVTSVMHLDARDLTFVERSGGMRAADIEVLATTFGDNGQVADERSRNYTFTLSANAHADALSGGLVYQIQVPLKRPGPYQLRIALRDVASDRIGSASRFIDVPDVKKGRLTLSGLVMQGVTPTPGSGSPDADQRDPQSTLAVRTFRQGTDASYVCSIYNARRGADGRPQLEAEVRVYREGVEILRGALRGAVTLPAAGAPLVGAVLHLGEALPPGGYVLELAVEDRLAKTPARATQTIDFDVIR